MQTVIEYIPHTAKPIVKNYLKEFKIDIRISSKRKTKHGDFRYYPNGQTRITVNQMDNTYRFLITLIHELAHFAVYRKYGSRVKPHGIEWKQQFRNLMLPLLSPEVFPDPLLPCLAKHLKNPKASSESDLELAMCLNAFDPGPRPQRVYELKPGMRFTIPNGRIFVIEKKRVKRYECRELKTGHVYLFSPQVAVKRLDSD